jgi:hemolysin activation/secretion protein
LLSGANHGGAAASAPVSKSLRGLVWLAGVLAALGAAPALAQTAGQITPPTFRPDQPRPGAAVVFSGRAGLEAPPGAERLFVRIARVSVEGGRPELAAAHQALEARLAGQRVPASEIFAAARDLEAAYARAGFVLARVVLPAQTLRDGGSMRLVVVEGFIERVELREVPDRLQPRVLAILQPLVGRRDLTLAQLERRLLIASDMPGVVLRSVLSPGAALGATILVVEARYRPVTGFFGADNTLPAALGRWSFGAGVDANTVLGLGETFYVRTFGNPVGFGDRYPRLRTLAAGAVFPLGIDGLTFNIEAVESRTTPDIRGLPGVAGLPPGSTSVYDRLSLRVRYPWVRTRALTYSSEVILDVAREDLRLLTPAGSFPVSLDRLRVLRLASDLSARLDGAGVLVARTVSSYGLDAFGARTAAEAARSLVPLSRQGADADFKKLEASLSYVHPLHENLALALHARGQTSFGDPLPRSEQIGLATPLELSTFDAGTVVGDSGWALRAELQSPWTIPVGGMPLSIAPYLFAATGAVYLHQPTALERSVTRASSAGFGVRLGAAIEPPFTHATLSIEFGRRFRSDGLPDANRITLVGAIRF